jgi:adenylate cyclase
VANANAARVSVPTLIDAPASSSVNPSTADLAPSLTEAMLRTELVRIRVLIVATSALVIALYVMFTWVSQALPRLWHGSLQPNVLYVIMIPFILFELAAHVEVKRQLKRGGDIPVLRRYLGVLVETSVPTVALAVHIDNMGPQLALGFVVPLSYFIFIILSTLRLDFTLSAFTGAVAALELLGMAMLYHPATAPDLGYHLARSAIILVCGLLAGTVATLLRREFEGGIAAARARDRVADVFGRHVSPVIAERLLDTRPGAQTELRQVAVMFVDFRGFTADARSRSPQQVVDRLDDAFAKLVRVVDRHGGIVNKFLGDGFLALFGLPFESPDAAWRAVAAARRMIEAMARDNTTNDWPLRVGIAVHYGRVVAGSIGSPSRKEYTVIGDTVNFASRLEALNKTYGSQLLISQVVYDATPDACADAVPLGDVTLRGFDEPIPIWKLA